MEELYHSSLRLNEDIKRCFERYERASDEVASQMAREIEKKLDQVHGNCQRLDTLVMKEPPQRRHVAKIRVDELKYDLRHMSAALRNLQQRRDERLQDERNREELLKRTFTTNENQHTSILIDQSVQFHSRAQNAHREVDDLLGSGGAILSNLRDQRNTLKNARRRMMDVVSTLGMSNTVMRLIEKRGGQDKFILYGGMLVTCVIMFLVVMYFT